MYDFDWADIERVLNENNVILSYEDEKVVGVTSKDEDNDLSFSLNSGNLSSIHLKNDRVKLDYRNNDSEIFLHIVYGKRSAVVVNKSN